jgi:hypothetical protein
MIGQSHFFDPIPSYLKSIPGFAPVSSDMILERNKPLCYAKRKLAKAMTEGGGHFVLVALSGEIGCLSTAVEAFHRNHKVTLFGRRIYKSRDGPDHRKGDTCNGDSADRSLWRRDDHRELDLRANVKRGRVTMEVCCAQEDIGCFHPIDTVPR